jgi:hypothetical protein
MEITTERYLQIRKPKVSNIGLIAMNFTAEYMSIDSECCCCRPCDGLGEFHHVC